MSDLIFKEDTHQYFVGKTELISVSKLISLYKKPFDSTGEIIKKCAERDGKTVEELRKEWDYERDSAALRGTNFHRQAQHWVETGEILNEDYKDVVEQLSKIPFRGKLKSEAKIFDKDLGLAGTCDLLAEYGNNLVDLLDFKTNKRLLKKSFWDRETRNYQRMLYPVNHLQDCNFVHYSIQLSLYGIILEQNGYFLKDATILYIHPKSRQIEIHPILPLRKEALSIINHYKKMKSL